MWGTERHTDGHTRGGQEAEAGATILLLFSQLTPPLLPLEPTPILALSPTPEVTAKNSGSLCCDQGLGHMMDQKRADLTTVSFSGSLDIQDPQG